MKYTLPVLVLRNDTLLPNTNDSFYISRERSMQALKAAVDRRILVFRQLDKTKEYIGSEIELYSNGVLAEITSNNLDRIVLGRREVVYFSGISRVKMVRLVAVEPYIMAEVEDDLDDFDENSVQTKTLRVKVIEILKDFSEIMKKNNRVEITDKYLMQKSNKEINSEIFMDSEVKDLIDDAKTKSIDNLTYSITKTIVPEEKQNILQIKSVYTRMINILSFIQEIIDGEKIKKEIEDSVKNRSKKNQKEAIIREQIRLLTEELGESKAETNSLKERIDAKNLPEEVQNKLIKEVERMEAISPASPDYALLNNHVDTVLSLPWGIYSEDIIDLKKAREILDEDHFGLERVKKLILEFLAVKKMSKNINSPILCLVGAPGVGKTSIAKSIARAMDKDFINMSLGGLHDESEIRGHRKTYVGAMPGRIIYNMTKAKTNNPVFLLDEIDKVARDARSDPSSALLEVLDPAQNAFFRDNYVEVPYDLSKVFFITTANDRSAIQKPLLDRMEVIEMSSYTIEEKFEIAKRYLEPKARKNAGFGDIKVSVADEAIYEIIENYTREAGVRELERNFIAIYRKLALEHVEDGKVTKKIDKKTVNRLLGVSLGGDPDVVQGEIGAVNGLAWTSVGGVMMPIEVRLLPEGKGDIILTGKLGDVMKESARIAVSLIKSNLHNYNLDADLFSKYDIHIHAPDGATPKDGPSAGVTITTAIMSAILKRPVVKNLAMTGEISLRGKVMAIGGLKEKTIAAERSGIKKVIIPSENKKNLEDLPKSVADKLEFVFADTISDVLSNAFEGGI